MILEVRAVPPFMKNGFIVGCERTHDAIIIDPGDEVDQLLAEVHQRDLFVRYILLTHAHVDHVTGVAAAREALDAPVYLHKDDLFLYERAVQMGAMFGLDVSQPPPVDEFFDGSDIHFGELTVSVHHTPGHCPGGVCLRIREQAGRGQGEAVERGKGVHLFVGDTLFAGSIGRTDLPGGDFQVLMRSITEVIFPLGDEAIVHPGHGPDTTVRLERETNPFVLEYLKLKR